MRDRKYYFRLDAPTPLIVMVIDNIVYADCKKCMGFGAYTRKIAPLVGPISNEDFIPELVATYGGVM